MDMFHGTHVFYPGANCLLSSQIILFISYYCLKNIPEPEKGFIRITCFFFNELELLCSVSLFTYLISIHKYTHVETCDSNT